MVLATLAILSLGPTVTHQANAVRVGDLVASVAEQSALPLDCSPALATEPVVTEFRDRPLEEVLDALAWVVGAEWEEREGRRTLVRSSSLRARLEREEREMRARWWTEYLDSQLTSLDTEKLEERLAAFLPRYQAFLETTPSDEQYSEILGELDKANPVREITLRLLKEIGPEELASLPSGEPVVYSDFPTPMQRQLPSKSRTLLESLHALVGKLARPPRGATQYSNLPWVSRPNAAYGKTLLILRPARTYGARPRIVVVSAEGRAMMEQEVSVPDPGWRAENGETPLDISSFVRLFARLQQDIGYAAASSLSLRLRNGQWVRASFGITEPEQEGMSLDFGFAELLRDPVAHDPLGIVAGTLLRQCAQKLQRPLLATVPDTAAYFLGRPLRWGQIGTVEELIAFLCHQPFPFAEARSDSWLMLRPAPPLAGRQRYAREAAKDFIAEIAKAGSATLSQARRYVQRRPGLPHFSSLDRVLITHANPGVSRASVEALLDSPVDLFAALDPAAFAGLQRAPVPFTRLAPAAQAIIHRWVYSMDSLPAPPLTPAREWSEQVLLSEPTERWPRGLPSDLMVSIEVQRFPAVFATTATGHVHTLGIHELAFRELWALTGQTEALVPAGAALPEYQTMLPADQTRYIVRLAFPDGVEITRQTQETQPRQGAKPVPPDALPDDLKRQINEIVRNMGDG